MKKVLLATLLILLVAAGCNKSAQNQQTNNAQPNTQTVQLTQVYSNTIDKYAFGFPGGYEVRGFNDYGTDVAAAPTDKSVGVRKTGDTNFVFHISQDGSISKLSQDAIKSEISRNNGNIANYSIESTNISGVPAFKVVYIGSDTSVVSDSYYTQQNQGSKVLIINVVKNNTVAQQILNSFQFTK